jgi:ankyrin repeat protein
VQSGAIINTGDMTNGLPLHNAFSYFYSKVVWFLLNCGANVNAIDKNNNEETALQYASCAKIVCLLLNNGENIHATLMNCWTKYHCASYNGDLTVVQLLLQCRANIHAEIQHKAKLL